MRETRLFLLKGKMSANEMEKKRTEKEVKENIIQKEIGNGKHIEREGGEIRKKERKKEEEREKKRGRK